jgi:hypothetical protein
MRPHAPFCQGRHTVEMLPPGGGHWGLRALAGDGGREA